MTSNPILAAIAAAAPALASEFVALIESDKPAIEAKIVGAEDVVIGFVANAILSALPKSGIVNTLFAAEAKTIVNGLAKNAIAQAGGYATAAIGLAELEITQLGKQLSTI